MKLTKWAEQVQDRFKWKDIVERARSLIRVVAPQKKKKKKGEEKKENEKKEKKKENEKKEKVHIITTWL